VPVDGTKLKLKGKQPDAWAAINMKNSEALVCSVSWTKEYLRRIGILKAETKQLYNNFTHNSIIQCLRDFLKLY
jgi:transposase-like protein